jgi:hypothetical protein
MPSQCVGANVVVVARQFNPSVFSQLWLVRNRIVGEDEFIGGCLFSDDVAKIESRDFGLLVIPPQLQFHPRVATEREGDLVAEKVSTIVQTLPHTPYLAVGLNFVWHIWPEDGDIHTFSRSLFLRQSGPFFDVFGDGDDSLFGAYVSKAVLGCRLRLDVKPVDVPMNEPAVRRLLFAFNFQMDVPQDNPIPPIEEHLRLWGRARDEACHIVDVVERYREEPT